MPRKNEIDDLYFRFLHLKKAAEDVTRHRTLDALEQEILTDIAKADLAGKMLNAGDLIHSRSASPGTVHKRPGDLKKLGYIRIKPLRGPYPAKATALSDRAVRFFNELPGHRPDSGFLPHRVAGVRS